MKINLQDSAAKISRYAETSLHEAEKLLKAF